MSPTLGVTSMLAQQLPGARIEQADVAGVPLHGDFLAEPAGRRAVVAGVDLDAVVQMHRAPPELVVPKRLDGQRPQAGPLLGEHGGDLALGRAVDARVGPAGVPAIEVGLRGLEGVKAQSL